MCFKDDWEQKNTWNPQNMKMNTVYIPNPEDEIKVFAKGEPSEPRENVQNSQYPPPPTQQKKVQHTKLAECRRLDGICNCVSWIPKLKGPKKFLVPKFWEPPKNL